MPPDSSNNADFELSNAIADDVNAEIEELDYLGLRMALGNSRPRRLIRQFARACLLNKLNFAKTWVARGPFPHMQAQGLSNLHQALAVGKGVVIAACHVGQYHRIPFVLNELDVPVTLLLDGENKAREEQELAGWSALYQGTLERPIEYLNAELPTSPWRMSQALKQRRALFVYMDGGTGLKDADPARTCVEVKFLRLLLRVRKGLAYVAGRAGAPIVPAICSQNAQGEQSVAFCSPCVLNDVETLDAYCVRALQYCYCILEEQVLQDPASWEEWYHVHRWVVYPGATIRQSPPPQPGLEQSQKVRFLFDRENTEILKMPAGRILFQTVTGTAIAANPAVAAILHAARRPAAATDLLALNPAVTEVAEPTLMLQQLEAAGFLLRLP
jgi:lauroyl/myristoyl acyltransferase